MPRDFYCPICGYDVLPGDGHDEEDRAEAGELMEAFGELVDENMEHLAFLEAEYADD